MSSRECRSEARRFTWLIDVFYDHKIKLIRQDQAAAARRARCRRSSTAPCRIVRCSRANTCWPSAVAGSTLA
ncbi:hypothetical protein [Massilia phosphatilytica]